MKPRTAVATYILAAVSSALANTTALEVHAQDHKQKSRNPLTDEQKARVRQIAEFYRDTVAQALATAEFEGDRAEIPHVQAMGAGDEPQTQTQTQGEPEALADPDVGKHFDPLGWGGTVFHGHGGDMPLRVNIGTVNIYVND